LKKNPAWIREKTKVKDIAQVFKQWKLRWTGHMTWTNGIRWTKKITDWLLSNDKQGRKKGIKEKEITAMTYGYKTWYLTKQTENLVGIAQRAWERVMFVITLRDWKRST